MQIYFKIFYRNIFLKFEKYLDNSLIDLNGIDKKSLIKRICQLYNNRCDYSYNLNSAIIDKKKNLQLIKKNQNHLNISTSQINTKNGSIKLYLIFFLKEFAKFIIRILKINFFLILSLFILQKKTQSLVLFYTNSNDNKKLKNFYKQNKTKNLIIRNKIYILRNDSDFINLISKYLDLKSKITLILLNFYSIYKFSKYISYNPFLVILNKDFSELEAYKILKKKKILHSNILDISQISDQTIWHHGLYDRAKTFFLWESNTPFIELKFQNFNKNNIRYVNSYIRTDVHIVNSKYQYNEVYKLNCTSLFKSKIIQNNYKNKLLKKKHSKYFKIGLFPTGIVTLGSLEISKEKCENLYSLKYQKKFILDVLSCINKLHKSKKLKKEIKLLIKPRHSYSTANLENREFLKFLNEIKHKYLFQIIIENENDIINCLSEINLSITMPFTSVGFEEYKIFKKRGFYYDSSKKLVDKLTNFSKEYVFINNVNNLNNKIKKIIK